MPAGRFVAHGLTLSPGAQLDLPDEIAHQVRSVLRMAVGDSVTLLDGHGGEYPAEVVAMDRKRMAVRTGARAEGLAGLSPPITLCLGLIKPARFEMALQKCTELGVSAFLPLMTERSQPVAEVTGEARRRRWQSIVSEAIEQCGASYLPALGEPMALGDALASRPAGTLDVLAWEGAHGLTIGQAVAQAGQISAVRVFIGPEGGFSAAEGQVAAAARARLVTLGSRILRAETAAIVACALAIAASGGGM
ncbi:MAG TPA: RsmE family RNA methyltransferase [Ktedonobacterales bacterium]